MRIHLERAAVRERESKMAHVVNGRTDTSLPKQSQRRGERLGRLAGHKMMYCPVSRDVAEVGSYYNFRTRSVPFTEEQYPKLVIHAESPYGPSDYLLQRVRATHT
jgi:hypothetical protein